MSIMFVQSVIECELMRTRMIKCVRTIYKIAISGGLMTLFIQDIDTKFNTLMRDPYYVRISADNLGLEGIHHFYYTVKTDKVKHQIFCNKISRFAHLKVVTDFELHEKIQN